MFIRVLIGITVCLGATPGALYAMGSAPQKVFTQKTITTNSGKTKNYAVFIPKNYSADRKWPVILFLHGGGEGGTDGLKPTTVGLGPAIEARADTFPFIAVFPQSENGEWDENSEAASDAMEILHAVERDYSADLGCVTLTGLSNGGYGAWAISSKYPSEFRALIPVCAQSDYKDVDTIAKRFDVTAYSYSADPVVWSQNTTGMVDAINQAGGHARAIIIDGFGHDVWHQAYENQDAYDWILSTCSQPSR